MLSLIIAAAAVATTPALVEPANTTDSPAIIEAKANRALVKIRPEVKSDKPKWFDEELAIQRKLGHHGQVVIEGIIGLDGRYTDLHVRTSSGAPDFDAMAMKAVAATVFAPARDSAGNPIAIWAVFPFEKLPASAGDGTLFTYRCDEAVRDFVWWRSAWPQAKTDSYRLYLLIGGLELMQTIIATNKIDPRTADFAARWEQAMVACKASPSEKFLKALRSPTAR